ncbi:MAG: lamin tail domain-containing protein, partial [Solirubrobacterales bacterium]
GVDQHGGTVPAGASLSMVKSAAGGTIWYTLDGSDPRVPGSAGVEGNVTLVAENAAKRVLIPTGAIDNAWRGGSGFDDSGWVSGTGGVGYERSIGYEPYFNIDVQTAMYGQNGTCCIRIPFEVPAGDLEAITSLVLRMRYDDGYVAYLNGVEVARANAAGEPTWDSQASTTHSDVDAVEFEEVSISEFVGALRPGANILAIQGLNEPTTSSDFLISIELTAGKGVVGETPNGVSPTAIAYTDPLTLEASARVKARVLYGTTWSALHEAVFAVGPVAESLRISEIMYHPAETGDPNDPNTEYIELTNIGTQTVNLNLVRFTDGIDFQFPSVELAPGGYCLAVRDRAAFESRYSSGLPVVGCYAGNLSNAGEQIELRDAAGTVIHSFRFEDDWYKATDGGGFSLVVTDPWTVDAGALGDPSHWLPSAEPGGSPGARDSLVTP